MSRTLPAGKVGDLCARHGCGFTLIAAVHVTTGKTTVECPGCNRRAMGLCRDCDTTIKRKGAARCRVCAKRRRLAINAANKARAYRDNRNGYRDYQVTYQRRRREDPVARALDNAKQLERQKKSGPRKRTHWDRLKERARRQAQPQELTDAQRKRRRDRVRERYHTDPEFRARRLKYIKEHRAPMTDERRARKNADARKRYAKNPDLRARSIAANASRRARLASERQGCAT